MSKKKYSLENVKDIISVIMYHINEGIPEYKVEMEYIEKYEQVFLNIQKREE